MSRDGGCEGRVIVDTGCGDEKFFEFLTGLCRRIPIPHIIFIT